jgi:hypothetical protein
MNNPATGLIGSDVHAKSTAITLRGLDTGEAAFCRYRRREALRIDQGAHPAQRACVMTPVNSPTWATAGR